MLQSLNALHTRLIRSKESLAKEAPTGNQADRQPTAIGHVGLRATNLAASAEFCGDIFGTEITSGSPPDHPLGATAFLSSRPDQESRVIVSECFASQYSVAGCSEEEAFYA